MSPAGGNLRPGCVADEMALLQHGDVLKIFGGCLASCCSSPARVATAKADHQAIAKDRGTEFAAFQRSYIVVYVVVMLADWLQGTHMFTLYTEYAQTNPSVSVGTLFFTGFLAAGILSTFTGPSSTSTAASARAWFTSHSR